jgi:hypothetical protein
MTNTELSTYAGEQADSRCPGDDRRRMIAAYENKIETDHASRSGPLQAHMSWDIHQRLPRR